MTDIAPPPPERPTRLSAAQVIDRFREVFGRDEEGMETGHAAAFWHVIALSHLIIADMEALLKDVGRSPADIFVLGVLLIEGDRRLRPSDIARILYVTPAAISQRLAKLEEAGLVVRDADRADGRIVRLALSDKGRALARLALARSGSAGAFGRSLAKLPPGEPGRLEETLRALIAEMERHVVRT